MNVELLGVVELRGLESAGIVSPEPWRLIDCPDVRVGRIS